MCPKKLILLIILKMIKDTFFFCCLILIIGCDPHDNLEVVSLQHSNDLDLRIFISLENADYLGRPSEIKANKKELFLSDSGFYRITEVAQDGKMKSAYGSRGKGPGEFDAPSRFWVFDEYVMVYDYNNQKFIAYDRSGNVISESVIESNPTNPYGFPPNIPITVEAVSLTQLLIPSRGRKGSLFAIYDIDSGDQQFCGEAISSHVETYNYEEVNASFARGEIPPIFRNFISLSASSSGIYSFQQTTGILEKFSLDCELIWRKNVVLDEQEKLFEEIAHKNRLAAENNKPTQLFTYARSVEAHEDGVAILFNMPDQSPLTLYGISSDGKKMHRVDYSNLDQEEISSVGSFTISPQLGKVFFLNSTEGVIYQGDWPVYSRIE